MEDLQILTVKETCRILNCSVPTIYRWCNDGTLPIPKLKLGPNKVGFRKSDLKAWLNGKLETENID